MTCMIVGYCRIFVGWLRTAWFAVNSSGGHYVFHEELPELPPCHVKFEELIVSIQTNLQQQYNYDQSHAYL